MNTARTWYMFCGNKHIYMTIAIFLQISHMRKLLYNSQSMKKLTSQCLFLKSYGNAQLGSYHLDNLCDIQSTETSCDVRVESKAVGPCVSDRDILQCHPKSQGNSNDMFSFNANVANGHLDNKPPLFSSSNEISRVGPNGSFNPNNLNSIQAILMISS